MNQRLVPSSVGTHRARREVDVPLVERVGLVRGDEAEVLAHPLHLDVFWDHLRLGGGGVFLSG